MAKLLNTTGTLDQALPLHRLGLRLVPLTGKVAIVKHWPDLHLSEADVRAWAKRGVNFAAITGDPLIVLDTDTEEADAWVQQKAIESPVMVRSGRGGLHRYFRKPENVPEIRSKNAMHTIKGLDLKAWHSYIVLPGSIHPDTGRRYEFLPGKELRSLHELPTFDLAWAEEFRSQPLWKPKSRAVAVSAWTGKIRDISAYIRGIPSIEGENGSNACYRVAAILFDAGYSFDEALEEMLDWEKTCAIPLWGRDVLTKKRADVWRRKMQALRAPGN